MNYPDDIRSYDHDPRSPFYQEWRCPTCGSVEGDTKCTNDWCDEEDCAQPDMED